MGNGIKKVNLDNLMNDIKVNDIKKSGAQSYNMSRTPIDVVGDILTQGSTPAQQDKISELMNENSKITYDSEGNAIVNNTAKDEYGNEVGFIYTVDKDGNIIKDEYIKDAYGDGKIYGHQICEYNKSGQMTKKIYKAGRYESQTLYNPSTGNKLSFTSKIEGLDFEKKFYDENGELTSEYEYARDGSHRQIKYYSDGTHTTSFFDKNGKTISANEFAKRIEKYPW